ncbi:MAG: GspH/FimT family pseudopilin [Steroidobacteraceae bacterium]|jgi:type IV fimbrial biogenesis protein FimT|nr:GspH/FimT family pseudopilin [Steroidobacteraceae bacterium]
MDRYVLGSAAACAVGHTLVELLVVLGLLGVLATLAVPSFAEWRANAARDERVSRLVRSLRLARTEALARGYPVVVCASAGADRCGREARWSDGWIAYVESRAPGDQRDAGERLLAHVDGRTSPTVRSSRRAIEFGPGSLAATTATLVVCDGRGTRAARAVIVSRTGRVRVSTRDAEDRALGCG